MYAIIETGGKQYKVAEGDVVQVEKLNAEPGNEVTFDKVIAVSDGAMKVADAVASAKVTGTVLDQGKGRKVIVSGEPDADGWVPIHTAELEGFVKVEYLDF